MKLSILILTVLAVIGCGDDNCGINLNIPSQFNQTVYDDNINTINTYLNQNLLVANSTESGLHYIITEEGTTNKPNLCDDVLIKYRGYLPDGTEFDASDEAISIGLSNVILGWQEGIPLYGAGGKGVLLIPSYLAYGSNSPTQLIPDNSVLIFDIELDAF